MLAIVGPTASGKSEVAIRLAAATGAEIVSCDSMQVYRGFDLGTAKPSPSERAQLRHHLIDVADADELFSAARYAAMADQAIADAQLRGRPLLIVGGTGLYLRALRFGLMDAPARDEALRQRWLVEETAQPGLLHHRLQKLDPTSAQRIEPRDLVRIVRALEVSELTGRALSQHHQAHVRQERHATRVVVLDPPMAQLEARIAARVDKMLTSGLVEETAQLARRFGSVRALGAVGYREVVQHLSGALGAHELTSAIAMATRQYAKRQRTWFKKEPGAIFYQSAEALYQAERPKLS